MTPSPTLAIRILCERLIRQAEQRKINRYDAEEYRLWLSIALDETDLLIPRQRKTNQGDAR